MYRIVVLYFDIKYNTQFNFNKGIDMDMEIEKSIPLIQKSGARGGITEDDVLLWLRAYHAATKDIPTQEEVRRMTGGSFSVIGPALKAWRELQKQEQPNQPKTIETPPLTDEALKAMEVATRILWEAASAVFANSITQERENSQEEIAKAQQNNRESCELADQLQTDKELLKKNIEELQLAVKKSITAAEERQTALNEMGGKLIEIENERDNAKKEARSAIEINSSLKEQLEAKKISANDLQDNLTKEIKLRETAELDLAVSKEQTKSEKVRANELSNREESAIQRAMAAEKLLRDTQELLNKSKDDARFTLERATAAELREKDLQSQIKEMQTNINNIQNNLELEIVRAKAAEASVKQLQEKFLAAESEAQAKITEIENSLQLETNRANAAELSVKNLQEKLFDAQSHLTLDKTTMAEEQEHSQRNEVK